MKDLNQSSTTGIAAIWIVVILLIVFGGVGFVAYSFMDQPDQETATETSTPESDESETHSQPIGLPEGFTLFADTDTNISFLYPSDWGEATLARDNFSHEGASYSFVFSENNSVSAGVKSTDFVYTDGPRGGFGAIGQGGTSYDEHVSNIESASTESGTDIIEQDDRYLMYSGLDIATGIFVSLAIQLDNPSFQYVEFAYLQDTLSDEIEAAESVTEFIDESYIEELKKIAEIN